MKQLERVENSYFYFFQVFFSFSVNNRIETKKKRFLFFVKHHTSQSGATSHSKERNKSGKKVLFLSYFILFSSLCVLINLIKLKEDKI